MTKSKPPAGGRIAPMVIRTSTNAAPERPTVEIGMVVALPLPANFLRPPVAPGEEAVAIDVATLSLSELQKVGEALKQNFIENAMERRRQKRRGQS